MKRGKRWTVRVFAHFLDLVVANSWLEYRNDCKLMNAATKGILDQFESNNRVAEMLIRAHFKEVAEVANAVELDLEIGVSVAVSKRTKRSVQFRRGAWHFLHHGTAVFDSLVHCTAVLDCNTAQEWCRRGAAKCCTSSLGGSTAWCSLKADDASSHRLNRAVAEHGVVRGSRRRATLTNTSSGRELCYSYAWQCRASCNVWGAFFFSCSELHDGKLTLLAYISDGVCFSAFYDAKGLPAAMKRACRADDTPTSMPLIEK